MEDTLPGRGPPAKLVTDLPPEMEAETDPSLEAVTLGTKGPLTGTRPTLLAAFRPTEGQRAGLLGGLLATRNNPQKPGTAGQPPEVKLVTPADRPPGSCALTIPS